MEVYQLLIFILNGSQGTTETENKPQGDPPPWQTDEHSTFHNLTSELIVYTVKYNGL